MKNCLKCGAEFVGSRSTQRFCSRVCQNRACKSGLSFDHSRPLSEVERQILQKAYKTPRLGFKRLAKEFQLGQHTVRRLLKAFGVPNQPTGWSKGLKLRRPKGEYWTRKRIEGLYFAAFKSELVRVRRSDLRWYAHPEFRNWRAKKHEMKNPDALLRKRLRTRIWHVLKGEDKSNTTLALTGCSAHELKNHIERQFRRGMSWANYGSAWEVDHITPCSAFDLSKPSEQQQAFHYTNLRPLSVTANRRKHARFKEGQGVLCL